MPQLNELPPFTTNSRQRSDVLVQFKGEVGFRAEVRSSPMLFTERKAIIGAADFLRLQRCKGHTEIDTITTFAFPNCGSIEITVSLCLLVVAAKEWNVAKQQVVLIALL